ncbi:MAG TPA: DUF1080 domain-containing protein [Woeseiaceae bacterium]|nr:DUF1080 domain-containing protein [Woeseiaceae bacterium]
MKTLMAAGLLLAASPFGGLAMAEQHFNALSEAEADAGWTLLFNGKTAAEWRNYGAADLDDRWQVSDGTLMLAAGGGGDIVTRKTYGNFELILDWRVSEGGNSGIFILVAESDEPIYYRAPEIQILDNERHSDSEIDSHRSGALYDLVAPHPSAHKPQGEWNSVRIRLEDGLLNVWQNDVPTATIVIGSSTWQTLIANSKFADWDGFGTGTTGRIGLQDHGDKVWFRNLKIRELD